MSIFKTVFRSEKVAFKMEQEQTNFLSGRKVNGKLAASLGAVFGIALTAVIAYVYFYAPMEINLALFIFVVGKFDGSF